MSNKELRCTSGGANAHGAASIHVITHSRGQSLRLPPPPAFTYLPDSLTDDVMSDEGTADAAEAATHSPTAAAEAATHSALNLATRATATDSCCGRAASAAMDADTRTDWRAPYSGDANLTIDLGRARWIGMVDVLWGSARDD